jgi:hypothetical protein
MAADYAKHNEAIRHGWVILYIMSKDVTDRNAPKTIRLILGIIKDRPTTIQKKLSSPPRSLYEETISKLLDPQ